MSRKSFLYYLFSAKKKPLYLNSDGAVLEGSEQTYSKLDGTPAHLKFSPEGWKGMLYKYARNIRYWGLFRDMTVPMKFPRDGGVIVRNRLHTQRGTETETYLGIAKLDRLSLPYEYKPWLFTELNLTKVRDGLEGVQVEALEGGVLKYLKAFENTEYEIPCDEFNILMDGMGMTCKFNYILADWTIDGMFEQHLVSFIFVDSEGTKVSLSPNPEVFLGLHVVNNYQATWTQWIFTSAKQTTVRVYGDWIIRSEHPELTQYKVRLRTSTNRTIELLDTSFSMGAHIIFDGGGVIEAGENVFLEAEWFGVNSLNYLSGQFHVEFVNTFDKTITKGISALTLGKRIVDKMTGGKYTLKSDWLAGRTDIAFTSGMALRRLVDPVLKISLADFFKTLGRWGAALYNDDDGLVIETFESVFNDAIIADLGEATGAFYEYAEDIAFNTIDVGSKVVDYDDVNGRFEYNQKQSWVTSVTKIVRLLDLVTPIRTDAYGAEFERMNFENKDTTDSKSDNDTWMLNIEKVLTNIPPADPYYKLNRPVYITMTGIPDPVGAFNQLFSPHRSILENGSFIHSMLYDLDMDKITLASAEKNKELHSNYAGVDVIEKEDISVGALPAKLFLPFYITFTTQLPLNMMELLKANPYGKVKFRWNNRVWYGFLMDGGVMPANNDKQTWKLLSAVENKLILFNA